MQFLQKQHLMDYSLLVGIHQCKLHRQSDEDEEDGDDEGSEEESDNGRSGTNDDVIVEEDEDSAEANGDISSEGVGGGEGMGGQGEWEDVWRDKWMYTESGLAG